MLVNNMKVFIITMGFRFCCWSNYVQVYDGCFGHTEDASCLSKQNPQAAAKNNSHSLVYN